jgi:DNA-damage-inducible protein J
MAKSAMIHARIDPALKAEVETILQELGLSATQAITLFYQQIKLHQGLPFAVRLPNQVSVHTSKENEVEHAEFSCTDQAFFHQQGV